MTKLSPEDLKRLAEELEHIMRVGHGELTIQVAGSRIISWKGNAQWEFRIKGG